MDASPTGTAVPCSVTTPVIRRVCWASAVGAIAVNRHTTKAHDLWTGFIANASAWREQRQRRINGLSLTSTGGRGGLTPCILLVTSRGCARVSRDGRLAGI